MVVQEESRTNRKCDSNILFKNKKHEAFYEENLPKCRLQDVYHKALVYCLGLCEETRRYINRIYDFNTGYVKTECLKEGWQTGSSTKVTRIAFNLYCGGTPSVYDSEEMEEQLEECQSYAVDDLFCCGYAKYFWEAVKIRYPEYCRI